MKKGKIFSIEELSTYDGPGIRMTVFMKGCPLRCMWCHNPEGQRFESEMVRSPNGCLKCNACIKKGSELTGKDIIVPESISVCPRNLIRMSGEEYTAEQLINRIEKNIPILNMSSGGVTFSGGEPLCQAEFVAECMRLLRGKTNRALQTCGYADSDTFRLVLKECDYVLYDLKLMDNDKHRYYTGVSNELILNNYRILVESGKEFCTRIPLIPTVNDTEENITATAGFMRSLGIDYVELLPYNKMAGSKYAMLGRTYLPDFDDNTGPQMHRDIFHSYGIKTKTL